MWQSCDQSGSELRKLWHHLSAKGKSGANLKSLLFQNTNINVTCNSPRPSIVSAILYLCHLCYSGAKTVRFAYFLIKKKYICHQPKRHEKESLWKGMEKRLKTDENAGWMELMWWEEEGEEKERGRGGDEAGRRSVCLLAGGISSSSSRRRRRTMDHLRYGS